LNARFQSATVEEQDLLQSDFATGSPSKAPNIIDSTQDAPALGQDPDFLDFLTAQERNDINEDINAINRIEK